jgi:two-component system NtrC family sensor kinase
MTAAGPDGQSATRLSTVEESALVYEAVVASALDSVIIVDEAGCVVALNPAAESTFGYSAREAIGRQISDLIVPDHLKAAHEAGMARYRASREPRVLGRRVEMEARCKDGRVIPVELAITEVNLLDRRLFTANLRDLSAQRAAAAEIERQKEALHQSEKLAAIGSLLAGVAHELNNPLSILLGQATMLHEEMDSAAGAAPVARRAEKLVTAAERCARVVRSFLAIARQRKAETRAIAILPLLNGAIDLLQYKLQSSGVTVTLQCDGSEPEIFADPDQAQQIVVNLLVNAVQALEEVEEPREITISPRLRRDQLGIVFADNGPGIPPHIARRIFEPYFTTKPQGVGTGIGLSISRGLAEAQGGQLSLVAQPRRGAAFELSLPLAAAPAMEGEEQGRAPAGTATAQRRAIVIDDELEIAVLIAEALQRKGYRCDIAASGREGQALIAALGSGYDAVICDLRMPDLDGPGLYRWMQTHHPALAERTLFVTGDALGPAAGRFLAESRRPVLEKPFVPAEVVRMIAGFPKHRVTDSA